MAIYKEMTTIVPGWAKYCAVDEVGAIWIYDRKPRQRDCYWSLPRNEHGQLTGKADCIGRGPPPNNWRNELYDLVEK